MGFIQIFSIVVTKEKNAVSKYCYLCSYQIIFILSCNGTWVVNGFVGSLQIYLSSIVSRQYCHGIHNEMQYSDRYYFDFI
jgi:hypothetical protein